MQYTATTGFAFLFEHGMMVVSDSRASSISSTNKAGDVNDKEHTLVICKRMYYLNLFYSWPKKIGIWNISV